nr:unnamed protein product [Callosobruchus chinensis]
MKKCVHQELIKYLELHHLINLHNLQSYGLPVKLCGWLAYFLSDLKISVVLISKEAFKDRFYAALILYIGIVEHYLLIDSRFQKYAAKLVFTVDAVQRRAIRLIGDPALTCHLPPLSHRRAAGDLSLFHHYSNRFCSSELASIIPPFSKTPRCTRRTSHPRAVVLHTSRTERYDRTFVLRVSRAWNGLLATDLLLPVALYSDGCFTFKVL